MYFKKLEIFGFKSFSDKSLLRFEPGITAIVGPNGCGKSNIFDAVRWVLGEQSVKELRGSSMEDVIFNGTDQKPALGFAEVSLTFSNESKMLPIEYSEVTVTRRLFRSGESEYLINKTVVRLKDILELFMGTGIGAEAYSLVQQGKVDLIVSARPEDRRLFFDEASGITKYKSRKREALNKLKETADNLLRVNDIILEVKRQIASIERQANKARKYKEQFERLKSLEVKLTIYQVGISHKQKEEILHLLDELKIREVQLKNEVGEMDGLLTQETDFQDELEDKINDMRAEEIRVENQIDRESQRIEFNRERIENINSNEMKLDEQKRQLIDSCREQKRKIEELQKNLFAFAEMQEKDSCLLQEKREKLEAITSFICLNKQSIKQNEERILFLTSQQVKVKNKLTEVMKESQGYLARHRRLEIENTKVSGEKEEIDNKLKRLDSEICQTSITIERLKKEQASEEETLNSQKQQLSDVERIISELDKKKLFLKSQKEFIEELRVQYQDMPDPIAAGRLFTKVMPREKQTGIIGKIKEVLPVDPLKESVLNNNNLVQTQSMSFYEIVCETKFIELDPEEMASKMEGVTREIDQKAQEKETSVLKIQGQQELVNRIKDNVNSREKKMMIFEAQKNDILGETSKILSELKLVGQEIDEAKENFAILERQESDLGQQLNQIEQEMQGCNSTIKQKQEEIAIKSKEREETTVIIAQVQAEMESVRDKESSHQDNLRMFSEALDNGLIGIKRIGDEFSEQQVRKVNLEEEIKGVQSRIEELKQKKTFLKDSRYEHEKKKDDVSHRINSIRQNIISVEQEIENIKNDIHNQQLKEQEISFNEKGIKERLWQTYKINFEEVIGDVRQKNFEGEGQALDEGSLKGGTESSRDNQETIQKSSQDLDQEVNIDELTGEIDRLRKRCDSFGSVNLVAIEEFEELKERFEFLTKQQSDLLTARESLQHTINKINRTTRQMFIETFTKVGEEFRKYFRMLFGGGEGQLVLLDPENVLESGIEIIARPPGKKLQNISLLSGGERSLTAIALIFGVFKVKPSPFCILDEIDAALDEANIGRFGYLLKEFAKIAQFIIITHNKKTIMGADVIYGITMQNTGISTIVSAKFSEKKEDIQEGLPVGVA